MELWPHQVRAIGGTQAALARGVRRLLVTSPTGTGKTVIMSELIRHWLGEGLRVVLYSNRRWLVQQTSKVLAGAGLAHGVRAAGYADDRELELQVSSVQTEVARVLKAGTWGLHPADRVLVDEAHLQTGGGAQQLLRGHREQGAAVVGLTATPLGLGHLYDELLVAGTASEGRACGALVPALHFGPDEPDLRAAKLGRLAAGADLSENQQRKVMGGVEGGQADERLCRLFGRVLDWFKALNPENRPSLLFAPGVAESIWFAEQFSEAGITAAHVDGNSIWLDGRLERSTAKRREQILEMSEDGTITVLCNRFVLREGIDAPWLAHGVLATVFGSLQSYLQSGGRLLRNHPSLGSVCVQDHGGNWWRHGSLNADHRWELDYTGSVVAGLREDALREPGQAQPVRCPRCGMIRQWRGPCCPTCGYEMPRSAVSRPVVQSDGTLKEVRGDVFKPRRITKRPDGPALWQRMVYRSRTARGERTFKAAAALFAVENHGWPDPAWPLMPREARDWYRLVKDVPAERLTPKGP